MPGLAEHGHTDIISTGWIARLPRGWAPYALLARLDRPIGVWLLFLPGLWSILLGGHVAGLAAWPTVRLVALFLAGAVLMRGAGCVINDMWDRDLDRRVTRTAGRPLASGAVGMRGAFFFLAVLAALALTILLQLDEEAIRLGVRSLVLVVMYPLAKRFTWWPQLMLGVTFGWGAPMGYAAATGRLDAAAGVLYLGAICWILGYDTIYAHQDREDDALIGVRSTARLFGANSRPFLAACYSATVVCVARERLARRAVLAVLRGPAAAGGTAGAAGSSAGHRQPRPLSETVPGQPRRRARGRTGAAAGLAVIDPAAFVRANTLPAQAPLVPELTLHLATEITPIWQATEDWLSEHNIEPPFWAFAWPGGQALARHLLDHPEVVAGRRVLDFAAGCGIAAIACRPRRRGHGGGRRDRPARHRRDPAQRRRQRAAGHRRWRPTWSGRAGRWDLILCGDVCYEAPMTAHILPWLRHGSRTRGGVACRPRPRLPAG